MNWEMDGRMKEKENETRKIETKMIRKSTQWFPWDNLVEIKWT